MSQAAKTEITETTDTPGAARCTLWQLVRCMLRLGTWGFGGPVAPVGFMYRDRVEQRKWISEAECKEGMALARRPGIVAVVDGVTAAAIGAIAGAVIVIGERSITDWATAVLAIVTVAVLWRFKKMPEPLVVVVAAVNGVVVHPLMKHA